MKKNPHFALRVFLLVGDLVAIIVSFGLAYFYRTHYDPRPYIWGSDTSQFVVTMMTLLPIWVILLFASGAYDRSVYPYRPKSYWRLLVVSVVGVMSVIAYSYATETTIFPARLIAVYALILCFVLLVLEREIILATRRVLLRSGRGVLNAAIVGNNDNTRVIVEHLQSNPESGYRVAAVIALPEFIPSFAKTLRHPSLAEAIASTKLDVVIQTDELRTEKVYFDTVDHHLQYLYVPSQKVLLSHLGEMYIMGTQPIIHVHTTPLVGWSRVVKRTFDIVLGTIAFIVALPVMLIIALIIKFSEPKAKVLYKTARLSRFGKTVNILKFRSMKHAYNNLSPEEAFEKMGKPELAKAYRKNGDQLDSDPRVGKLGKFIRATSLDELPQLINVIKGDISLVGPRALVPQELHQYHNKNLILSVKSGLTGLAQVSGRRNISFEERRALDIYYIQNWSLGLDIQIILRTVVSVLLRRGAR